MDLRGLRLGPILLAMSVVVPAACQHAGGSQVSRLPLANLTGEGRRLSDEQVADVQFALGRTFEQHGELDRAMAAYLAAAKRDPQRAEPYLRLAVLHDLEGKFADSARFYQRALQADPGNADIFCDRGYSFYLQRRWSDAEMNLKQAVALEPELARAHNNLALVYAHTGEVDEALAEFQIGGSNPQDAHMSVAAAAMLNRRWDEARRQYELALTLDPVSEAAEAGLQQLARIAPQAAANTPDSAREDGFAIVAAYSREGPVAEPSSLPISDFFTDPMSTEASTPGSAPLATLAEIAIALAQTGDLQDALSAAAEINTNDASRRGGFYYIRALAGIAAVQAAGGDHEMAAMLFHEALRLAEATQQSGEKTRALRMISAAQAASGDLNGALFTAARIQGDLVNRDLSLLHIVINM